MLSSPEILHMMALWFYTPFLSILLLEESVVTKALDESACGLSWICTCGLSPPKFSDLDLWMICRKQVLGFTGHVTCRSTCESYVMWCVLKAYIGVFMIHLSNPCESSTPLPPTWICDDSWETDDLDLWVRLLRGIPMDHLANHPQVIGTHTEP